MGCTGSKHKDGGVANNQLNRKNRRCNGDGDDGDNANYDRDNKNNKNRRAPPHGDGIAAFAPSRSLADAYAKYICEVREAGVAAGIMSPVARPHAKERASTLENIRVNPPQGGVGADGERRGNSDSDGNSSSDSDGSGSSGSGRVCGADGVEPIAGDGVAPPSQRAAVPPPPSATVFQCRPLHPDPPIGKGQYSQVQLAAMVVVRGDLGSIAPFRPRALEAAGAASKGKWDADDTRSHHSSSIVLAATAGGSSSVGGFGSQVVAPHGERHFLLAMKEAALLGSQPQAAVLEHVRVAVGEWTRLSAYSPRILRCVQMECAYSVRSGGELVHCPVAGATFHSFPGVIRPETGAPLSGQAPHQQSASSSGGGGRRGLGLIRRRSTGAAKGAGDVFTTPDPPSSGVPSRIRIYMEFAKYGTLRTFQLREMPDKFDKARLHELTARALMREVLLALADLHDQDTLQYDLCAKRVFLVRPIRSVYRSYFPAYISDLPVGSLLSMPPKRLHEALTLLNPSLPPQQGAADAKNRSNSAVSGLAQSPTTGRLQRPQCYPNTGYMEEASGRAIAQHRSLSMVAIPPPESERTQQQQHLQDLTTATEDNNNNNNNNSGGRSSATGGSPPPLQALQYNPVPGSGSSNSAQDCASAELAASSTIVYNHLLLGEQPWQKDHFREYMMEHGYEDCVSLPVPSPHDGFLDADLAAAVSKLTLKEELTPNDRCLQIVPLHGTRDGGVAVISHNPYGDANQNSAIGNDNAAGGDRASRRTLSTSSLSYATNGPGARVGPEASPSPPPCAASAVPSVPQCLPASQDPYGFVLPPSAAAAAAASGAESGNHPLAPNAGSPTCSSHSGFFASPAASRRQQQQQQLALGGRAPAAGMDNFRGPLVRLNHTASVRRSLALTNTCPRLGDVPVHRFVTVTHAAPEVLQRKAFSTKSDIFAFAMTFIELVTERGEMMEEAQPPNLPKPRTRKEKDEYDGVLAANLNRWYNARIDAINKHRAAVAAEQRLPDRISPQHDPVVVRIPDHLSDECKNMLKWCLQAEVDKRPTAAELLRSNYFLLGDWIASDGVSAPCVHAGEEGEGEREGGVESRPLRVPERPWDGAAGDEATFAALAQAAGFPTVPEAPRSGSRSAPRTAQTK